MGSFNPACALFAAKPDQVSHEAVGGVLAGFLLTASFEDPDRAAEERAGLEGPVPWSLRRSRSVFRVRSIVVVLMLSNAPRTLFPALLMEHRFSMSFQGGHSLRLACTQKVSQGLSLAVQLKISFSLVTTPPLLDRSCL